MTQAASIPTLYRGSVKDLRGPVEIGGQAAVVFDYSDAYSVFDWGRMPDALPQKGEALAMMAADLFERLERPETWKEFSRTPEALALRKGNKFGSVFNELGEELQNRGMKTHYLGILKQLGDSPKKLSEVATPARYLAVRQVAVIKPALATVLGRALPDYIANRQAVGPKLVPLEVVFRFSCPPGSSLFERVARDPGYLGSIGFPDAKIEAGQKWDFPVLELFTKLESTDRPVSLAEALAIAGISAERLQELLLKTAWIAGLLRSLCSKAGLELADGKVEWALDEKGALMLVDAIGPDELRILKDGTQISKEFLRTHYRGTPWYEAVGKAKQQARNQGVAEWKKLVVDGPPPLPTQHRELGSQLYMTLANRLTGKTWFPQAWSLEQLVARLKDVETR